MKTRVLFYFAVALAIFSVAGGTAAQSKVARTTQSLELRALANTLKERDAVDRRQVSDIARRMGIPLRRELLDGRVLELQRFIPGRGPVFYITNNVDAADSVSTDEVYVGGSAGLSLDGSGMTVGEWDGGAVALHPGEVELQGSVRPIRSGFRVAVLEAVAVRLDLRRELVAPVPAGR